MIDEAHERSLQTDMCLGLLKKIQKVRPELRLIIASATLDANFFKDYFEQNLSSNPENDTARIIYLEGGTFSVDIFYLSKPCPDYMKESLETVLKIHKKNEPGDILIFLTSAEDVDSLTETLEEKSEALLQRAKDVGVRMMKMKVYRLYGSLPVQDQFRVFENVNRNTRKGWLLLYT